MPADNVVLAIVLTPLLGAVLVPVLGKISIAFRNLFSLLLVAGCFVFSLTLIPFVMAGKTAIFSFSLPLGLDFKLYVDALAVFMACVSSFISLVIVFYSFDYISHYENQNEYYFMVVVFIGSMMGIVFSANLIFLYLFWEMTAIASWRLIGFYREPNDVLRADKAFLVTVFGALFMLVGFLSLSQAGGTFDLLKIKDTFGAVPVSNLVVTLILFGILSKSATLPFHTWLPDAGVAPSPVTALLHAAVLVKIGVYVYARLFVVGLDIAQFWHAAVPWIAATSAIVSAGAALVETDLKRVIAYSTVSQIGFIFFGLAIGNQVGIAGGLLYIMMHGLAKAGLFLCAGIVEQKARTKDMTKLGGLLKTMPLTAVSFLFCSASVMGVPPFGGFFCKYLVFAGSIKSGQLAVSFVFLVGAFMTILYLLRAFRMVFLGEQKFPAREGSPMMVGAVVLLAALSLAGGILISYPMELINKCF